MKLFINDTLPVLDAEEDYDAGLLQSIRDYAYQFNRPWEVTDPLREGLAGAIRKYIPSDNIRAEQLEALIGNQKARLNDSIGQNMSQSDWDAHMREEAQRERTHSSINVLGDLADWIQPTPHAEPDTWYGKAAYNALGAIPGVAQSLAELHYLGPWSSVALNTVLGSNNAQQQVYSNLRGQGLSPDEAREQAQGITGNLADIATRGTFNALTMHALRQRIDPTSVVPPIAQYIDNILAGTTMASMGAMGEQAVTNYRSDIDDPDSVMKAGQNTALATGLTGVALGALNWRKIKALQEMYNKRQPIEADFRDITDEKSGLDSGKTPPQSPLDGQDITSEAPGDAARELPQGMLRLPEYGTSNASRLARYNAAVTARGFTPISNEFQPNASAREIAGYIYAGAISPQDALSMLNEAGLTPQQAQDFLDTGIRDAGFGTQSARQPELLDDGSIRPRFEYVVEPQTEQRNPDIYSNTPNRSGYSTDTRKVDTAQYKTPRVSVLNDIPDLEINVPGKPPVPTENVPPINALSGNQPQEPLPSIPTGNTNQTSNSIPLVGVLPQHDDRKEPYYDDDYYSDNGGNNANWTQDIPDTHIPDAPKINALSDSKDDDDYSAGIRKAEEAMQSGGLPRNYRNDLSDEIKNSSVKFLRGILDGFLRHATINEPNLFDRMSKKQLLAQISSADLQYKESLWNKKQQEAHKKEGDSIRDANSKIISSGQWTNEQIDFAHSLADDISTAVTKTLGDNSGIEAWDKKALIQYLHNLYPYTNEGEQRDKKLAEIAHNLGLKYFDDHPRWFRTADFISQALKSILGSDNKTTSTPDVTPQPAPTAATPNETPAPAPAHEKPQKPKPSAKLEKYSGSATGDERTSIDKKNLAVLDSMITGLPDNEQEIRSMLDGLNVPSLKGITRRRGNFHSDKATKADYINNIIAGLKLKHDRDPLYMPIPHDENAPQIPDETFSLTVGGKNYKLSPINGRLKVERINKGLLVDEGLLFINGHLHKFGMFGFQDTLRDEEEKLEQAIIQHLSGENGNKTAQAAPSKENMPLAEKVKNDTSAPDISQSEFESDKYVLYPLTNFYEVEQDTFAQQIMRKIVIGRINDNKRKLDTLDNKRDIVKALHTISDNDIMLMAKFEALTIDKNNPAESYAEKILEMRQREYTRNSPSTAKPEDAEHQPDKVSIAPDASRSASPIIRLANRIKPRILEVLQNEDAEIKPFSNNDLLTWAAQEFGSSKGQGKFDQQDVYNALELAINLAIKEDGINPSSAEDTHDAIDDITRLMRILQLIPTQTNRTEDKIKFQQFSTPPTLAYLVNWLADFDEVSIALEPSAGTGSLAVFAFNSGAGLITNELNDTRADILDYLFEPAFEEDKTLREDALHLYNILHLNEDESPDRVIMNPPFSAAGKQGTKNKNENGFQHVEQALKILRDGGRLVAILGAGRDGKGTSVANWLKHIAKTHNVRAVINSGGEAYKKFGTTFGNVIVVIDKSGASPKNSTIHYDFSGDFSSYEAIRNLFDTLAPLHDGFKTADEALTLEDMLKTGNASPKLDTPDNHDYSVEAFKKAFDALDMGRIFVKIPDLRRKLSWPRDVFDDMIRDLRDRRVIQLHTGDASLMTPDEVNDCFIDENNFRKGSVTWEGGNSSHDDDEPDAPTPTAPKPSPTQPSNPQPQDSSSTPADKAPKKSKGLSAEQAIERINNANSQDEIQSILDKCTVSNIDTIAKHFLHGTGIDKTLYCC